MFEHEKMSEEERKKMYGAHYESIREFKQLQEEQQQREQEEIEAKKNESPFGCLKKIILIILALFAMAVTRTIVRYVVGPHISKHFAARSRNSVESFDEAWNKLAKRFGEQWPLMKKKVIAEYVKEVKAEFEKQGCPLTAQNVEKLESLLTESIAGFDPERYFRNNKGTFLKQIGKSEEELNRLVAAAKTKEDVEALKKLTRQAFYDIGFEFGKSLRKPLSEAVERFVEYMAEQQKPRQNR